MNEKYDAEKVVIIAGTPGIGLKEIYNCVKNKRLNISDPACVYHFEDLLLEEYGSEDRCKDIEQLIAMMLTSRPAAISAFKRGVERVRERIHDRGCEKAIVFAHLTYMSRRMIAANPVISELLSLGREASIIYLVDDYFDALRAMALDASSRILGTKGCSGLPASPYSIDPVLYLTWRAADSNILGIVDSIKPGTSIYTYGVKHPAREFVKLLERVLKTRREYLVDSKPVTAYVSHPITQVRSLYVAVGDRPVRDISLVQAIEAFKEALRRTEQDLVLFEPTTIDEIHYDKLKKVLEYVPKGDLGRSWPEAREELNVDKDYPVVHSLFVDSWNRWPFSEDNLREYCSEHSIYPYSEGGSVSLLDPEMAVIYGDEHYHNIQVDILVHNLYLDSPRGEGALKGMLASQLHDLIKAQIEERDYAYVSQSDHIIAVTTAVVVDKEHSKETGLAEGVYIPLSTGMDAEIQRARALAKPISYYILPICIDTLLGHHNIPSLSKVISDGFKHCRVEIGDCSREEAVEAARKCAVTIQRGGLFATIGGGVRVCVAHVLYRRGDTVEELTESYRRSLC